MAMQTSHDGKPRALANPFITTDLPSKTSASNASTTRGTSGAITSDELQTAVNAMLKTPADRFYKLNAEGTVYVSPPTLSDTPVAKLNEGDEYWESDWSSLAEFLGEESKEEALKKEFYEKRKRNPGDKRYRKQYAFHLDNVSKHRKIRDIFGDASRYHPNQLISKDYLPCKGFCQREVMYRLACKVSDLRVLHERGELEMDPWDFLRWRINKKVQEIIDTPGQSFGNRDMRNICRYICADSGSKELKKYEDPLLRMAILRSARYKGRLGTFQSGTRASIAAPQKPSDIRGYRSTSQTSETMVLQPVVEDGE